MVQSLETHWNKSFLGENEGVLNYVTSGVKNNYNIICAAPKKDNKCKVPLFTLRKEDNPNEVLASLFDAAFRASGPIPQTGSPRDYYDVGFMIRQKSEEITESK